MTFQELLKASANGLPRVKARSAKSNYSPAGVVTVIKSNRDYTGCAVQFDGVPYDTWFYAEDGADGRKRYMRELDLEIEQATPAPALYVVVKKARGSKGIYREVMTEALDFEAAKEECSGLHISQMTDAVIDFYVTSFNGKGIGENY